MDLKKLAWGLLLGSSMVFTGCGDDDGVGMDGGGTDSAVDTGVVPVPLPGECADGECIFVTNELIIPDVAVMGGVEIADGFDVDGRNSDETDAEGCNIPDFTGTDGRVGVDNQLASLKPTLDSFIDGGLDQTIDEALADGSIILLMELMGADSTEDDSVSLNILLGQVPGGGTPMLGTDGKIAAGQTFDIDPTSVDASGNALVSVPARIEGGLLVAGPLDLPLSIPVDATTVLTLNIRQAGVEANVVDGALTGGLIGGELIIMELIDTVIAIGGDGVPIDVVRSTLESVADLSPDVDGICQSLSIGMVFGGVDAIKGNVASGM